MFNGTAFNCFPDIPSRPGAVPTGGRALEISEVVIRDHSSLKILGGAPAPGVVRHSDDISFSQKEVITFSGGILDVRLSLRSVLKQFERFFPHICWIVAYSSSTSF